MFIQRLPAEESPAPSVGAGGGGGGGCTIGGKLGQE